MNTNQYTQKTLEALQAAQQLAVEYQHNQLEPEHLLHALASQEQGLIPQLLQKLNVDPGSFSAAVAEKLSALPRVSGSGRDPDKVYISQAADKVLSAAAREAKAMKDDYISVEHVFLGLLDEQTQNTTELFRAFSITKDKFLQQLTAVRGNQRVTNDNPEETYNALQKYGQDLVDLARKQKLDPVIGRDQEIRNVIRILSRKTKNNPCLIGEPGVGKTAIAEGLAQRIAAGDVPFKLRDKQVYLLDLTALVAGTQFRGQFESRMKGLIDEVKKLGNIILVIDEVHSIVGAGDAEGSMNAANILKPALSRGEIQVIGATTLTEYRKYIEKDSALERRFQPVIVEEPSIDEAVEIIRGIAPYYEAFHKVTISPDMCRLAVTMSERYITDRYLPDKAIDLIDEAGAYREIHPAADGTKTVDRKLITEVLSRTCKIDANALKEEDNASLEALYERISGQIYGQDEAIRQVVEAVQMAKAGLLDENKPLASLLFVGPTGVGKTEVAKVLASELGISLVRFDMSEYMEKHTIAKLIGSPAGYIGYKDGGLLTDAIRKTPNCVLLLDEIEKAHPDIFNILLQVMDYAVLTDNKGRKSDCRHLILIMTSNAGAQYAHQASIGFNSQVSTGQAMLRQVKKTFKPEFLNRLSASVVFHDMSREMATQVLDKKLRQLDEKLARRHVCLHLTPEAHEWLLKEGFKPEYGAREMDRAIAAHLKPLLTREILFGSLKQGGDITVTAENNQLSILQ